MTLREIAHAAQHLLQSRAEGCVVKRSHVYELLAAAFGAQSWAAFHSDSLLADAGAGEVPAAVVSDVIGRALQLDYRQPEALEVARAMLAFITERKLSRVRWSEISGLLTQTPPIGDDEPWSAQDEMPVDAQGPEDVQAQSSIRERLLKSPLLLEVLEDVASNLSPARHHALAALYRCARPNPYLYEESLKGRVLTSAERTWVNEYLRLEPIFRRYERHLRAAALGGERPAAVEYAANFDRPEFFDLAERLTGDVDAERMARIAATPQARGKWLRAAAEQGSEGALRLLAGEGDQAALERLAGLGDLRAIRSSAELALERQDYLHAWTWQYVAVLHGGDFTKSTLHAYHDGGPQDGQFYDSDFGGPLAVDGEEALELPTMSRAQHREARALAREIFENASRPADVNPSNTQLSPRSS